MKKFALSAFAVMTAVALSANPLKGWSPTQGHIIPKNPDAVKIAADSITLKGIPKVNWIYFNSKGVNCGFGQKLEYTFTASGKGSVMVGSYEYRSGFSMSAQGDKKQTLSAEPKEYKIVIPVKGKDTTRACPRFTLTPGSEITITKYNVAVTGTIVKTTVEADHKDFLYKVGETAKFTLKVTGNGKELKEGTAQVFLRVNGFFQNKKTSYDLAKGPVKLDVTMKEPGFTVIYLTLKDKDGKVILKDQQVGSAGFSVDQIKAGRKAPADLLTYWHGQYEKLNKEVPADFQIIKTWNTRTHKIMNVTFNNFGGTKSYCAISIPLKIKGKMPMIFTVPPAGNYGFGNFTYPNAIRVTITVFDRLFPKHADYDTFNKPVWYFYKNRQARETYYYYKAILGMMRMMDYSMKNIKEWDGKHLAAVGRSQGGGSAFILAALNPKIQCVAADVPALCDHNAYDVKRRAGWPQVLRTGSGIAPTFHKDAEYFDAANFASFVKCPAVVTVGFYDTMCEPASVYAAYNNLKGEKTMINLPHYGHGWGERAANAFDKPTDELLKKTFAK